MLYTTSDMEKMREQAYWEGVKDVAKAVLFTVLIVAVAWLGSMV